jgi:hypothetical protein
MSQILPEASELVLNMEKTLENWSSFEESEEDK